MDGKKVICTTSSDGSSCSRLLFVLEPEEESEKAIQELLKDLRQVIENPTLVSTKQAAPSSSRKSIYWRWQKGEGRSTLPVSNSNRQGTGAGR
jgi:Circadian oscillating protein COP23